jgi:hypothetical protein
MFVFDCINFSSAAAPKYSGELWPYIIHARKTSIVYTMFRAEPIVCG